MDITHRKKLIEVALPLEAINKASAREKSIRHGHPSTLHLWWARRPLAAARAVIFAQMVDDPSAHPELFPTEEAQEQERRRLFKIIERLVQWENTTNEQVLQEARDEIWKSWRRTCADNADHPRAKELFDPERLPAFHDPFAGGGSLPLEAQRLGLEAYASDLNPVAVLINKAMIEIPPKFAGKPPVNPKSRQEGALIERRWRGAEGLAEDVRHYGQWMRDQAEKRIGHLYPKVEVTAEMAKDRPDLRPYIGRKLTVVAWIWARTVRSPNPAYAQIEVPLVSTFMLSTKKGKEVHVEPVIEGDEYYFKVVQGKPSDPAAAGSGTKLGRGAHFKCLMSGTPIESGYIKAEGQAGRMGTRLMAIVAQGERGRVYIPPTTEHDAIARAVVPGWKPETPLALDPRALWTVPYGLRCVGDLFTPRQLVALTTYSDLVHELRKFVISDASACGMPDDQVRLCSGGSGATAYADAVATYLGLAVSKLSDAQTSLCRWKPSMDQSIATFSRQALPMVWDYSEANVFGNMAGDFMVSLENMMRALSQIPYGMEGKVVQADARTASPDRNVIVSTDPPYYDNIGYADVSDFFYAWLRRTLRPVFPDLFATVAVPKAEELVATPYRHGSKAEADTFFLNGMTEAVNRLTQAVHPAYPVSIYYAFKQSETDRVDGTASTGWETFLEAVLNAGFAMSGTWPIRTELGNRLLGSGTNVLASSIVLVCRPRSEEAVSATRREFIAALRTELPRALSHMQQSNIAPVDLAQAAIGPGMAIFSRYRRVLDATGKEMSVREALALINQTLDEVLAEQDSAFDPDTRWAVAWFEEVGFSEAAYGVAETLSKAKNTSIAGMVEAGILVAGRGKVRLLRPWELSADWDPTKDERLTTWEIVHQLIRALNEAGETGAAALATKVGSRVESARELAYRLYTISERKKRSEDALSYNGLVQSWPEIMRLAREPSRVPPEQRRMTYGEGAE